MANLQLAAGTILQRTYSVVGAIGRGGMGQVYEVSHARLAGRYALKLLASEIAEQSEALARFKREADIVSKLRHPNIVQVIDFDQTPEGQPYLVMEFLDGENLEARLRRAGPMPLRQVVSLIKQIASALEAAHGQGIIHRDLKPENILLVTVAGHDGDFVKIVDFGISKVKSMTLRLTAQQMVMGTPHYMSPEQARGSDDVDEKTDQFALAAIAYELLTGQIAFGGDDVATIVYRVVYEQPPLFVRAGGCVNPAVDAILLRALDKKPLQRFASVAEFARALAAAAAGSEAQSQAAEIMGTAHTIPSSGPSAVTAPALSDDDGLPSGATSALSRGAIIVLVILAAAAFGGWILLRPPIAEPAAAPPPRPVIQAAEPVHQPAPIVEPAATSPPRPPAPPVRTLPRHRTPRFQDRLYNEL